MCFFPQTVWIKKCRAARKPRRFVDSMILLGEFVLSKNLLDVIAGLG